MVQPTRFVFVALCMFDLQRMITRNAPMMTLDKAMARRMEDMSVE